MKLTPLDPLPWQHLTFSSTHELARQAESRILADCRQHAFTQDDLFAIHMAIHEALVNAVKHGNQSNPARHVQVRYRVDPGQLEVTIQDEGPGFNPDSVADPTADENLQAPSGRGILLMRAYMDSVIFNPAANAVTMTKLKSPSQ